MKIRSLTEEEVDFGIQVELDGVDFVGNCSAIDDETDKEAEDEIRRRLENGDVWAWAHVEVVAMWRQFRGSDSLGGCSYKDEADFTQPGGYYDDMKRAALEDLQQNLERHAAVIEELTE